MKTANSQIQDLSKKLDTANAKFKSLQDQDALDYEASQDNCHAQIKDAVSKVLAAKPVIKQGDVAINESGLKWFFGEFEPYSEGLKGRITQAQQRCKKND